MTTKRSMPTKRSTWEIEEDLRTIRRAEEIRSNTERMAAVRKMAAKEVAAITKISKMKNGKGK